jgi:primosomal protein N'
MIDFASRSASSAWATNPNYEPRGQHSLWAPSAPAACPRSRSSYDALLDQRREELLYFPIYNYLEFNLDAVARDAHPPAGDAGPLDGGAHVGTICDASFPTFLLLSTGAGSRRGQDPRRARIVQMLAKDTARLPRALAIAGDRRKGSRADLNVIDLAHLKLALEWVASATERLEAPGSLRGQARELLAWLRATGPTPVARLEDRFSNARAASKRLEGLGLVKLERSERAVAPWFTESVERDAPPELTTAQQQAVSRISASIRGERDVRGFLLFGVTGSGKTEVYLRAIARRSRGTRRDRAGARDRADAPAREPLPRPLRRRCRGHASSGLLGARSPRDVAARVRGAVRVAIGARSALFAPVAEPGARDRRRGARQLVQARRGRALPRARHGALRAHRAGAVCVLGSATPSLESYELARTGKLEMLRLPDRARREAALPEVTVVDLKRIGAGPTGDKMLTLPLHRALDATLAKGQQASSSSTGAASRRRIVCGSCGHVATCKACSVALTFHQRRGAATCKAR